VHPYDESIKMYFHLVSAIYICYLKMGAELLPTVVALGSGLLGIPICYGYTLLCESLSPVGMLAMAGAIMTGVLAISAFLTRGKVKNKMYYGKVYLFYSSWKCHNTEPRKAE
jgi:hypothetical protein